MRPLSSNWVCAAVSRTDLDRFKTLEWESNTIRSGGVGAGGGAAAIEQGARDEGKDNAVHWGMQGKGSARAFLGEQGRGEGDKGETVLVCVCDMGSRLCL